MLRKNIYILYPPGYSGSYINWCLSKSEIDLSHLTIDDPLNTSVSLKYGGIGTSHLHHRIPTHASIKELIFWLILHKPAENKIFLLNARSDVRFQESIAQILLFDRDPIIIQITATDRHTQAIGNLNCVTKWPLYLDVIGVSKKRDLNFPYENNISNRNKFVTHYDEIFSTSYTLDYNTNTHNQGFCHTVDEYAHWYNIRNTHNPHEVNNIQYVEPYYEPKHYYAIDLMKVYSPNFVDLLKSIVEETEAGIFDFTHVREYHPKYVSTQPHLKFLDEIKEFNRTKQLTDYLCSHPLIQAYVVMELLPELSNNNWLDQTLQEIVKGVQSQ